MGIIFFEMLFGGWPFYGDSEYLLVDDIKKKILP
jgi:hypothetical protein